MNSYIYIYISTVWTGILMTFACFWDIFSRIFCCFFFWIFWKVVVPFSRVLACKILWYLFTWGQIHPRFLATPTAQMQAKQCSGAGAERWNGSTDQRFFLFLQLSFQYIPYLQRLFRFPFFQTITWQCERRRGHHADVFDSSYAWSRGIATFEFAFLNLTKLLCIFRIHPFQLILVGSRQTAFSRRIVVASFVNACDRPNLAVKTVKHCASKNLIQYNSI